MKAFNPRPNPPDLDFWGDRFEAYGESDHDDFIEDEFPDIQEEGEE